MIDYIIIMPGDNFMVSDKQFLLTPKAVLRDDYSNVQLKNGFYLNYSNKLKLQMNQDKSAAILGYVWQVDNTKKSPIDILNEIPSNCDLMDYITREDETWCGRYVIIVENYVVLDTAGLLGVFYADNAFSSSMQLLCDYTARKIVYPGLIHGTGVDWIPGPRTTDNTIKRLMPDQVLNYVEQRIYTRKLINRLIPVKNKEELIEKFINSFNTSLINMRHSLEGKIYVALTGGHDSRCTMALMEYAGIDYECFTLEHSHISKADYMISRNIVARVGKKYKYIKRNKKDYSKSRYEDYKKHTSGYAVDEDLLFYTYNQYQQISPDEKIIILRSGIWESVNNYYSKWIRNSIDMNSLSAHWFELKYDKDLIKSFKEYFEWEEQHSQDNINDYNKFYWNQREGCWLSSVEQSFDMMENVISIQPLNCRLLIELLLGFSEEERISKAFEESIVKRACPKLKGIAYDSDIQETKNIFIVFLTKIKRYHLYIKKFGMKILLREVLTK